MTLTDSTAHAVDAFIAELLATEDDALRRALKAGDEAGMPPIQVSAPHGTPNRPIAVTSFMFFSCLWLLGK